jgi:hypothetical protein
MFLRFSGNDRGSRHAGLLLSDRWIMMTSYLMHTFRDYLISAAHVSTEHALWLVQESFWSLLVCYAT